MSRSWIVGSLVVVVGLVAAAIAADPLEKNLGPLDKDVPPPAAPPAFEGEADSEGEYVITTAPYAVDDFVAIRFHSGSGASWVMQQGKWKRVAEVEEIEAGTYDIVIASSSQPNQKSWNAFRLEIPSGKSWRLNNGTWRPVEFAE